MRKVTILLLVLFGSCFYSFSQVELYRFTGFKGLEMVGDEFVIKEIKEIYDTGIFDKEKGVLRILGELTRVYAVKKFHGTEELTDIIRGDYVLYTYTVIDWMGDECILYYAKYDDKTFIRAMILYLQHKIGYEYTGDLLN